jgi:hypothetical protein
LHDFKGQEEIRTWLSDGAAFAAGAEPLVGGSEVALRQAAPEKKKAKTETAAEKKVNAQDTQL